MAMFSLAGILLSISLAPEATVPGRAERLALREGSSAGPRVAPDRPDPTRLTSDEWRHDLRFLATELEKWHANLYHTVSRERFQTSVTTLEQAIPDLQPHEIIVALSRIVASVNDAHTYLFPPSDGPFAFRRYGVQYEWFEDGIFVKATDRALSSILGARVLRIGESSIDEAVSRAAAIGYRENAMTTRLSVPRVLVMPEVLHALGIIGEAGAAPLLLRTREGKRMEVSLEPHPSNTTFDWMDARQGAAGETPLYLQRTDDPYWLEYLEDENALYVQLNRCQEKEEESLAHFAQRIQEVLRDTGAGRLVLDVRRNVGGNWESTLPLVHAVIQTPRINQKGRFFVIIGRLSLSATVVLLGELRWHTNVTFVGEPTGARPNLYGENPFALELPHSQLQVKWASEYFQPAGAFERRPWIAPEVAAEISSMDYFTNRDPALAAALSYRGGRDLRKELEQAAARDGITAAEAIYRGFREDPRNRYVDTFQVVRRFGNHLLDGGKVHEARRVFEWNRDAYPERSRSYIRLAHAHALLGTRAEAHRLFEESLERLPRDGTLHRSLRYALERYVREWLEKTAEDPPR